MGVQMTVSLAEHVKRIRERCLKKLNLIERDIVELYYGLSDGHKHDDREIAILHEIPEAEATRQRKRALEKLKMLVQTYRD